MIDRSEAVEGDGGGLRDLVQVCMPTRNGASHIREALNSLLAQTHKKLRILVVDNASTDGTAEIVAEYAQSDSRVYLYRNAEFVSASENWTRAFSQVDPSAGRFMMWAGDDDKWAPDFISKNLAALISDPACVLSFSDFARMDEDGQILQTRIFGASATGDWTGQSAFSSYRWLMSRGGGHCAICGIMRLDHVTWSPVFEDVCFGADLWFLIQLAARGKFRYLDEVLFYKRAGGISSTGDDASASLDPSRIWNIGPAERLAIEHLPAPRAARAYIYWRLAVQAKLMFPYKPIPLWLWPWFAILIAQSNPRGIGVRARVKRGLDALFSPARS